MGQGRWRGIPLSTACPIESRGLDRRDKVGGPLINARWSGGTLTVSEGNFTRTHQGGGQLFQHFTATFCQKRAFAAE